MLKGRNKRENNPCEECQGLGQTNNNAGCESLANLLTGHSPPIDWSDKRASHEVKMRHHIVSVFNEAVEDVNVTFEDQQKINKFARNNNKLIELREEIELKKKQLQNLEDASDDIMMLDEDAVLVPYQIGEVFISHSQDETQEMLEAAKQSLQDEIQALQSRVEAIQQVLSDLKVQLYAKFGNNINLEADDN
ncbi:prefoldin subunit 4 isoform X1 [Hemitrygon akajei]|uniref:prefoldin subunit 4 isoform X1 n=1 Tax=Hemitrygon akajei TaxID=2704970 RepID=UPI003BFA1323